MIEYGKGRMLKANVTENALMEYYKEYMDIYGEYIPEYDRYHMNLDYLNGLNDVIVPCYIMQFYDEYNLMLKQYNLYERFITLLKRVHPDLSNKTILDVGGGIIPSIGRKLAKEAKQVIVVDQDIADRNNPDNLEVIKQYITNYKELPKADLIIGFMPCEATQYIVDQACDINADFFIELCGCVHDNSIRYLSMSDSYKRILDYRTKEEYLTNKIKESGLGKVLTYPDPKNLPYPIMGNKR